MSCLIFNVVVMILVVFLLNCFSIFRRQSLTLGLVSCTIKRLELVDVCIRMSVVVSGIGDAGMDLALLFDLEKVREMSFQIG